MIIHETQFWRLSVYVAYRLFGIAVVASTKVVAFKGKETQYGQQCYIASTAATVGDIKLGELSSVWYGASVRGT